MGYMGLSHWAESDGAADFRHLIVGLKNKSAITKCIIKELKEDNSVWNTPGCINIALAMEDKETPDFSSYLTPEIFEKIISQLNYHISACEDKSQWDEEKNRKMHLKAYKRLLKVVKSKYENSKKD